VGQIFEKPEIPWRFAVLNGSFIPDLAEGD
jgi:hypothetical protein